MAGATAHGATFSFLGAVATITGISVEMPTAETTDMTSASNTASQLVIVPTGAWSGGAITIDFLTINVDPQTLVRSVGQLTFRSAGYTISRRVVCESASVSAQAGEIVRGSIRFRMTDYMGN